MFLPKPLRSKAPRCPVLRVAACTCIRLFIVSIGWVTRREARPLAAPATNWSKKEEGDDKNNVVFSSTTTSSPSLLLLSKSSSRISKKESISTPMFFISLFHRINHIQCPMHTNDLFFFFKSLFFRVKKNTSIPRRPLLTTTTKFSFVVVCLFCVCVSSLISKYSRCKASNNTYKRKKEREKRE